MKKSLCNTSLKPEVEAENEDGSTESKIKVKSLKVWFAST